MRNVLGSGFSCTIRFFSEEFLRYLSLKILKKPYIYFGRLIG